MAEDLIARLRRLDVCAVSDACDRLKLAPAITGIMSQTVRARIAGRIATVKVAAGEKKGGSAHHLCTAAIEAAEPGGVVVVEQTTGIDAAGWGGILSRAAKMRGLSGAIVDGPTRDVDEAFEIEFPVFARGRTARTARGRIHEADTNCPVHIGGQRIEPGEYVIADSSGIVFIKPGDIAAVLEAAEMIAAREAAMTKDVLAGKPVSEVMGASYEQLLGHK
ncbi:MAG: RraA family protein [Alphaproteobacteria bacterium]